MRFGIVIFPGSNCDQDCFYVIKDVLKRPAKYIWHGILILAILTVSSYREGLVMEII